MSKSRAKRVWVEFANQAENSPGGDKYIKFCYLAVLNLAEKDLRLRELIENVVETRKLTAAYLVNLFFRVIQYIQINHKKLNDYPHVLDSVSAWEKEIKDLLDHDYELLEELLMTKDTSTTIYQRYAGIKGIIAGLYGNSSVRVVDFGCGGNYGLCGIATGEPFKSIEDLTPKKSLMNLLELPVNFKEGLGLDREDPLDPEVRTWRLACSFYPKELELRREVEDFENRVYHTSNVSFKKGDAAKLNFGGGIMKLKEKFCDVVIMSTVLYQLEEEEREQVMTNARKILKDDGWLVIQDFARKTSDGEKLVFKGNWFKEAFGYRTFVKSKQTGNKFWEIWKWNNGRCRVVGAGKDLKFLYAILHKSKEIIRKEVEYVNP